jgi:translation initiation factor IF-2
LSAVVTTEEGRELAASFKMPFIETSAKTGEGVEEAFMMLVRAVNVSRHGRPALTS